MTARQQQIAAIVASKRADIIESLDRELADKPIGFSAQARLMSWDFGGGLAGQSVLRLLVTKVPEGYVWREDSLAFNRKGRTAPKARPL